MKFMGSVLYKFSYMIFERYYRTDVMYCTISLLDFLSVYNSISTIITCGYLDKRIAIYIYIYLKISLKCFLSQSLGLELEANRI